MNFQFIMLFINIFLSVLIGLFLILLIVMINISSIFADHLLLDFSELDPSHDIELGLAEV